MPQKVLNLILNLDEFIMLGKVKRVQTVDVQLLQNGKDVLNERGEPRAGAVVDVGNVQNDARAYHRRRNQINRHEIGDFIICLDDIRVDDILTRQKLVGEGLRRKIWCQPRFLK